MMQPTPLEDKALEGAEFFGARNSWYHITRIPWAHSHEILCWKWKSMHGILNFKKQGLEVLRHLYDNLFL